MADNDFDKTLEQRRNRGGSFDIMGDRRTKRNRDRSSQNRNAIRRDLES